MKHLFFRLGSAAAFVLLMAAPGCSRDGDSGASTSQSGIASTGLPCNVGEVLQRKCQSCHSNPPKFGAPMPLLTADDLHAPAHSDPTKKVYERVSVRTHATTRPMPPSGPLAAPDLQILDDWIAAGAPHSAATCAPPVVDDAGTGTLPCTPDVSLKPSKPWTIDAPLDDDYICYGVDVGPATKRHVTALAPRADNARVLHHMDLYEAPDSYPTDPTRCSAFGSAEWRLVFAWAPGGKSLVMPSEAGFPLNPNTHYVVQIHYSNATHVEGQDASGVDLCTTDQLRPNDADVMAFGSDHFVIPARSNYDLTCRVALGPTAPDLHLFAVMPHMHGNGVSLEQTLIPKADGSTPIELASQPHWDIQNQTWFEIDQMLHAGDHIATRCKWTNPKDDPIYWGDAAADEMCYAFTMYYPRITDPTWLWSIPASQSACTPAAP